jgi:hypothetical protein
MSFLQLPVGTCVPVIYRLAPGNVLALSSRLMIVRFLQVQVYCEFFNLMTEPKTTDHTVSAVNFLPHDHTSCPLYLV